MYAEARWYWRGDAETTERCPWYPMPSEANAALETAFTSFKECSGSDFHLRCFAVGSDVFSANFRMMAQVSFKEGGCGGRCCFYVHRGKPLHMPQQTAFGLGSDKAIGREQDTGRDSTPDKDKKK